MNNVLLYESPAFVYRFLDKDNTIIYVGKTTNLIQRIRNHEKIDKRVISVEFIACTTEAEAAWKEIYYINLYYNEKSLNKAEVFPGGLPDMNFKDVWYKYQKYNFNECNNKYKTADEYREIISYYSDLINPLLIDITYHEKINSIGIDKNSFSYKWLNDNKDKHITIKRHLSNYFRNLMDSKSKDCLWTTYYELADMLAVKGSTRGYISMNNINNKFNSKRHNLAYLRNDYLPAGSEYAQKDSDLYALSLLLQFIYSSAIQKNEPINIYIPSSRMRRLLQNWIKIQVTS